MFCSAHRVKFAVMGLVALVLLTPFVARASEASGSNLAHELSRKDRLQVLSDVAGAIEQNYLDPVRGGDISAGLRLRATRSRLHYSSPMVFARETSTFFFEVSGDRHLSLKWMPDLGEPPLVNTARTFDHGIRSVQFLDGNVGLLRLDGFYDNAAARESMVAALLVLRSSDALIFDFRENRGGASDAVRFLQSCFFAEPTLVMYYEDVPGEKKPSMTETAPGALNCRDKPFYILTSARTASAAEDFIYTASLLDHGVIIGETTAGAANFIDHKWIEPGFRLAVSVGRPVHPQTGTNWEGTGIRPDIEAPEDRALERAHVEALTQLQQGASDHHKNQLLYHLHRARALDAPTQLSNGALKLFVRRYGDVRITLTTDGLLFEDPTGVTSRLAPLGNTIFGMDGRDSPQVIFHLNEDASDFLELLYPDGTLERQY